MSNRDDSSPATAENAPLEGWDKFEVEETRRSLEEAGKRATNALGFLIISLASASVVAMADIGDSPVKINLLGLELNRWIAGEVLLVLSCVAFYRFFSLRALEKVYVRKLRIIFQRCGVDDYTWCLTYPSFWACHGWILEKFPQPIKALSYIPALSLLAAPFLLIPYLAWRIGQAVHYTHGWLAAVALSAVFLGASLLLGGFFPNSDKDISEIFQALEQHVDTSR